MGWSGDQLTLLLALAAWQSQRPAAFRCTEMIEHARTHCAVIAQFLPVRFAVRERAESGATIQVDVGTA